MAPNVISLRSFPLVGYASPELSEYATIAIAPVTIKSAVNRDTDFRKEFLFDV